jgi:hypothetical protein
MAAAALAVGALRRGAAQVALLCRRPLVQQAYECDVGWWGSKRLNAFSQASDPAERLLACRDACRRASLNAAAWKELGAAAGSGRLSVLEGAEVGSCTDVASGTALEAGSGCCWQLELQPVRELGADQSPSQHTPFQQTVELRAAGSSSAAGGAALRHTMFVDAVWLACGQAHDAGGDPLLGALRAAVPLPVVGGYAPLDPGTCAWPGAPVYFVGRSAMLAVGPSAGDAAGARLAAARVAASLQRLDFAGQPDWAAASAALRASTSALSGGRGLEGADLQLEKEGEAWVEPRRRRAGAASGVIDVSDLLPALLRRQVAQYTVADDGGFLVKVSFRVEEHDQQALQRPGALRCLVTASSLEVWAVGAAAAHRLHVPRLYGRVLPSRCKAVVSARGTRVNVTLHKESDAKWPFLRG